MAEGARDLSGPFYKDTNPIHGGSSLMISSPPNAIMLGSRISTYEFWGETYIQNIADPPKI